MTKLETLLFNARKALAYDNTYWPPSPKTVIEAIEELQQDATIRNFQIVRTEENKSSQQAMRELIK